MPHRRSTRWRRAPSAVSRLNPTTSVPSSARVRRSSRPLPSRSAIARRVVSAGCPVPTARRGASDRALDSRRPRTASIQRISATPSPSKSPCPAKLASERVRLEAGTRHRNRSTQRSSVAVSSRASRRSRPRRVRQADEALGRVQAESLGEGGRKVGRTEERLAVGDEELSRRVLPDDLAKRISVRVSGAASATPAEIS